MNSTPIKAIQLGIRIVKELAISLGHLLKRLAIFLAKKAKSGGKPKAIQATYLLKKIIVFVARKTKPIVKEAGYLLKISAIALGRKAKSELKPKAITISLLIKYQTIIAIKRLNSVVKPKIIEAGFLLKILLILAIRKAKEEGIAKAIEIGYLLKGLSILLGRRVYKVLKETRKAIREDIVAEKQIQASVASRPLLPPTSDIILEKRIDLNEKLAEEIKKSGVDCKALEENDIGSLQIEKGPYYSYNFPMSPRIITNRGCIRLKDKNISMIQIIQRN